MVLCWLVCLPPASLWAGPYPEQLDRLQADLTPVGALRAGNTDGRIPEWTGGVNEPPRGYQRGTVHIDPFDGETALLRISLNFSKSGGMRVILHGLIWRDSMLIDNQMG